MTLLLYAGWITFRDTVRKISFIEIHANTSSFSSRSECGLPFADKTMWKKKNNTAQLVSDIQKLERQRIHLTWDPLNRAIVVHMVWQYMSLSMCRQLGDQAQWIQGLERHVLLDQLHLLLWLNDSLWWMMERLFMVYLDFSKAFDTVFLWGNWLPGAWTGILFFG